MEEVVYDNSFFDEQVSGSLASARTILPILFEFYKPQSIVDVGCGRGAWLRSASELDVIQILGLDGPYVQQDRFLIDQCHFHVCDLKERIDLGKRFDLAISVEVAEHLPFHRSETFVADLTKLSDVVLFSAALPYQGGVNHINEQWLEFWAILFRRHGYVACDLFRRRIWGNKDVEFWYTQNLMLFCTQSLAGELFPGDTLATDRPLSFVHPETFLTNLTRYRPLTKRAIDFEFRDYKAILTAYLSGDTTLPIMKMLDAAWNVNGAKLPLFPSARTEAINVEDALESARQENGRLLSEVAALQEQSVDLAEHQSEIGSLTQALDRRAAELAELQNQAATLKKTLEKCSAELAEERNQTSSLTQTLDQRTAELEELRNQIAGLTQTLDQRTAELEELRNQIAGLAQIVDQRTAENLDLSRRFADSETRFTAVTQSRSWRVTNPLRQLRAKFRFSSSTLFRLPRLFKDWWAIRKSPLFDSSWYANRYPDANTFRWGPSAHYLLEGKSRGFDPHPSFDTSHYLETNPDVAESGINPLGHYLRHGAREGRDPSTSFDSDWYLSQYPDVKAAGVNPLIHYVQYGAREGRRPTPEMGFVAESVLPAPQVQPAFDERIRTLRSDLAARVDQISKRVTVIIPCYNYGGFVLEAVDSALQQIYPRIDVIVVDDGSTDEYTRSVLAGISHERVLVHRQENQGLSVSRNNGAQLTDADYLIFLDADDRLAPEAVALLVLELEANSDRAYAYPDQRFFGDQELVWACQNYNAYDLLWRNHPTVCSLIRGDWFRGSAGYRPQMLFGHEDWEYWLELSGRGGFGLSVPVPAFEHRRHGVTMTQTAQARQDYLAVTMRRLNEGAYTPESIVARKIQWRPTVSVVIPFYNRPEYLPETLTSLKAQSITDFEIIIVNDGSDDADAVALLDSMRGDPQIRIIDVPHGGVSAARNRGVTAARSEYIFFLDSDDLLEPIALEKLTLLAALHPHHAFYYSGVTHFGAINGVVCDPFDRDRLLRENFLTVSCMIRRSRYMEVGGQDESLVNEYEDYDLWLRFLEHGHSGLLLREPLFKYRRHANSRTEDRKTDGSHEGVLTRVRDRYPTLYEGPPTDRSNWKLIKRDPEKRLAITQEFSDVYRTGSGLPYENWRLTNMPSPFQPRYWNDGRYHVLYCIPFCTIGGAETVDLDILSALPRDTFHITLVTAKENEQQWLSRFRSLVDEIYSLPNLLANPAQAEGLLLYLAFSRNADLIFNRNTQEGYTVGATVRQITNTVAVADLLHVHDQGRDWVKFSAPFHAQLEARIVIYAGLGQYANAAYALPAEDFTTIHNGVDTSRALSKTQARKASASVRSACGIPEDADVIGFVGRLADQKDPIRGIKATAHMLKTVPSLHFIMVGEGEMRPQVEGLIRELDLENRVHLLGYRHNVDEIYAAMDILILTSKYEGLPMVVLEAMLQGVPVVSTRTGGLEECVTPDTGTPVPADASPEYIAEQTLLLLNRIKSDPSIRDRCRARIQQHFGLERMRSAYREEFERLCSGRDRNKRLSDYQTWFMTNLFPW